MSRVTIEEIRSVCGGDYSLAEQVEELIDRDRADLKGQIDDLASYIMDHVPGEPSQNEGAVYCAIRVMEKQAEEIKQYQDLVRRGGLTSILMERGRGESDDIG